MAKPDNPGKEEPIGTIERRTETPQLGQPCEFAIAMAGVKPPQSVPGVYLEAKQGESVVYGETIWVEPDQTSVTFTIGGGSSDWLENIPPAQKSQPAECIGRLFWRDQKVTTQTTLDETAFTAGGIT